MRGFTLMEVIVSIAVLAVGLVSMALLMARTMSGTVQSKYLSLAGILASEKLEDLNRWPANDAHIAVTSGSTAGSLSSDIVQNVTANGSTTSVNYYDQVALSADNGTFSEIFSGLDANGKTIYTTISHTPSGSVVTTTSTTPPAGATLAFKRRWLIEKDTPLAGVRRVTVRVIPLDRTIQPPVNFQMSMVRP